MTLTAPDTNIYIIYNIELYWDGYIVQEQEYILKLNRNKICFFVVEVYKHRKKSVHILAYKEFVLLLQCMLMRGLCVRAKYINFLSVISVSAFSSGEILWRIKKAT